MSDDDAIVRGWASAAEIAGRSIASVRKLVDAGKLAATKDSEGVLVFKRNELEGLPPVQTAAPRAPEVEPVSNGAEALFPSPKAVPVDEGQVIAAIFADLQAGNDLRTIVVSRHAQPETVRRAYQAWLDLGNVDALRTPPAEARLAALEERLEVLASQLAAIETAVFAASTETASSRQGIERRLRSVELVPRPAGVPAAVLQRIDLLEQQVRHLPAAPLLLPERRCGCGAPLAVLACCPACGAGRAAS